MKLSIVCPAYREDENLEPFISELLSATETLPYLLEIILVVDEPSDFSKQIIDKFEDPELFTIYNPVAKGKSKAFQDGFEKSTGDIIFLLETDLQYEPNEIGRFVDALEWGYDVASGHRIERADPLHRRLMSKFFNYVIRILFGIRIYDNNSGFKAFRREVLEDLLSNVDVEEDYYGYHRFISVDATKKGYSLVNVPISHYPRLHGKSYISFWRTGLKVGLDLFKIWIRS